MGRVLVGSSFCSFILRGSTLHFQDFAGFHLPNFPCQQTRCHTTNHIHPIIIENQTPKAAAYRIEDRPFSVLWVFPQLQRFAFEALHSSLADFRLDSEDSWLQVHNDHKIQMTKKAHALHTHPLMRAYDNFSTWKSCETFLIEVHPSTSRHVLPNAKVSKTNLLS